MGCCAGQWQALASEWLSPAQISSLTSAQSQVGVPGEALRREGWVLLVVPEYGRHRIWLGAQADLDLNDFLSFGVTLGKSVGLSVLTCDLGAASPLTSQGVRASEKARTRWTQGLAPSPVARLWGAAARACLTAQTPPASQGEG